MIFFHQEACQQDSVRFRSNTWARGSTGRAWAGSCPPSWMLRSWGRKQTYRLLDLSGEFRSFLGEHLQMTGILPHFIGIFRGKIMRQNAYHPSSKILVKQFSISVWFFFAQIKVSKKEVHKIVFSFLISGLMNVACLALTISLSKSNFYNYYADLSEIAQKGKYFS